jgi:hypothetical protein
VRCCRSRHHGRFDAAPDDDPLCRQFASRPAGELEGLTSKVEFWTVEGKKSVYLTVNFVRVSGIVGGQQVVIERPVEFFVPAGQRDEGQQWISSNMRLLSMVARSGASISKALANMCEVVWDKGPVRCGFVTREDGAQAPRFHDSEVAAIGHALQQILARRGFLDSLGNQVPVAALARRLAARDQASTEATVPGGLAAATAQAGVENSNLANVANLKRQEVPRVRRARAAQGRRLPAMRELPPHRQLRLTPMRHPCGLQQHGHGDDTVAGPVAAPQRCDINIEARTS